MLKTLGKLSLSVLACTMFAAAQIPAGTHVSVRLGSEISSATAHAGESFQGTLARSLVVNGKTIAKAGAPVSGKVTLAKPSGRLQHPGELSLRLTSVDTESGTVAIHTAPYHRVAESHKKSNIEKIGGGAAAGAVIGAIAGGGKGAAIGSAAGAGAGTGVAAYTGKKDIVLPAESMVSFTVSSGSTTTAHKAAH